MKILCGERTMYKCYYSKTTINTRVDGVTVYIRFIHMVTFRNGTFGVITDVFAICIGGRNNAGKKFIGKTEGDIGRDYQIQKRKWFFTDGQGTVQISWT